MLFKNVKQVAQWRLCTGCGACVYICPEKKIHLADIIHDGLRPVLKDENCKSCNDCLKVCPGYEIVQEPPNDREKCILSLRRDWGPILEIWEGYASDPEIRFLGSSGGLATALSLYGLEKRNISCTVQIGEDKTNSLKNRTFVSRTRKELIDRTGSRYAPGAPCEGLSQAEIENGSFVFVGKPCDIAGLRKATAIRPQLTEKVGLAIGIFCAGTPATLGTLELLKSIDVNPGDVAELRYRGSGWPGNFSVKLKNDDHIKTLSYKNSWGFLQKYRPYRCHLCPDGTGEFADISCGDPWYRQNEADNPGQSLILVRTKKGEEILKGAISEGYISAKPANHNILMNSQKSLYGKRASIWGRLMAFGAWGLSKPRYEGFSLLSSWLTLPLMGKIKSVAGTMRRIIQRKYYRPQIFSAKKGLDEKAERI